MYNIQFKEPFINPIFAQILLTPGVSVANSCAPCLSDTYKTDVHEACSVQTVTGAANDPRVGGEK